MSAEISIGLLHSVTVSDAMELRRPRPGEVITSVRLKNMTLIVQTETPELWVSNRGMGYFRWMNITVEKNSGS